MMSDFKFEELSVYRKAIEFINEIYLLTKSFPNEEMFGLTAQLRRAAVSISLNIAEGSARSKKDFGRFIDMAKGSLCECIAVLQIAFRQNYVEECKYNDLRADLAEISKMLSGLKKSLVA
jgi:four helix bundle protein